MAAFRILTIGGGTGFGRALRWVAWTADPGLLPRYAPAPRNLRAAAELARAAGRLGPPPGAPAPFRGRRRYAASAIIGPCASSTPQDRYARTTTTPSRPWTAVDVDELLALIRAKQYFVLHAPRQTGKTSALIALRDLLNSGAAGNFRCVHTNVEVGQVARDDTARGCCTTTFRTSRGALCWKHRGRTMRWAICCPTGA